MDDENLDMPPLLLLPSILSPSQLPNRRRFSIDSGRSSMLTHLGKTQVLP